jgi:hypothetical protein
VWTGPGVDDWSVLIMEDWGGIAFDLSSELLMLELGFDLELGMWYDLAGVW